MWIIRSYIDKWIKFSTIVFLCSCSTPSKFPDFVKVYTDPNGCYAYVDPNSVIEEADLSIAFSLVRKTRVGYSIQESKLTPSNKLLSQDGVEFSSTGMRVGTSQATCIEISKGSDKATAAIAAFLRSKVDKMHSFDGPFRESEALRAVYSNFDPTINGSVRKDVKMPDDSIAPSAVSKVVISKEYLDSDGAHHVLLISTEPDNYECHICAPLTSIVIFKRSMRGWKLETRCENAHIPGHDGEPAECAWEQIGDHKWGFIVRATTGDQGFFRHSAFLLLVAQNETKVLLEKHVDFENDDPHPYYEFLFHKSKKPFWDVTLKTKSSNKLESSLSKYMFKNDAYVRCTKT